MYKVFIENRVIEFVHSKNANEEFSESWIDFNPNLRIQHVLDFMEQYDLLSCTVVYKEDFEAELKAVFSDYKWVEAAGGIVKKNKSYLFIERHGCWDIPKGKLDKGENPEAAAIREVEEECGIVGPTINHLLTITYHTYNFKGKPTLKKTYWFAMDYSGNEELVPQLDESITQAVWFTKEEWRLVAANTFASIHQVLHAGEAW